LEDSLKQETNLGIDRALGMAIMGITGGTIGFYLGGNFLILMGFFLGGVLGFAVAGLGARRFFISILVGLAVGAATSFMIDRVEDILVILAGSGAAAGGFIGINIELLKRKGKKKTFLNL
jgi:hypothetical protein